MERGLDGNRPSPHRMSWHHIPKDDAWKQAHLAMVARFAAPGKPRGMVAIGAGCATS